MEAMIIGMRIFIIIFISFVWCGRVLVFCGQSVEVRWQVLGIGSLFQPCWGRVSVFCFFLLHCIFQASWLNRFPCLSLWFWSRSAGVSDVCYRTQLFTWVPGVELRSSGLCSKHCYRPRKAHPDEVLAFSRRWAETACENNGLRELHSGVDSWSTSASHPVKPCTCLESPLCDVAAGSHRLAELL